MRLEHLGLAHSAFAMTEVWIKVHKSNMPSGSLGGEADLRIDKVDQIVVVLAVVIIEHFRAKQSNAHGITLGRLGVEKFGIACYVDASGMRGNFCRQVPEEPVELLWEEFIYICASYRQGSFTWTPPDAKDARIQDFTKSRIVSSSCDCYLEPISAESNRL